jgi:hypothetical protein
VTLVRQEPFKLAELWPMGGRVERDVLAHWCIHRPLMMAQPEARKVAEKLAHVLVDRMMNAQTACLRAGMASTDATQQDWMMMEPESENQLLDQPEPTTTLAPPND